MGDVLLHHAMINHRQDVNSNIWTDNKCSRGLFSDYYAVFLLFDGRWVDHLYRNLTLQSDIRNVLDKYIQVLDTFYDQLLSSSSLSSQSQPSMASWFDHQQLVQIYGILLRYTTDTKNMEIN